MEREATVVRPQRVELALSAFGLSETEDAHDALCTQLGSLGVEVSNRAFTRSRGAESAEVQKHWHSFSRSCQYMTKRLGDLLTRLLLVRWIHSQRLAAETHTSGWHARFAELCIKDFHADAASFMDSLAPVVAQVAKPLSASELKSPPGFSDIVQYSDSPRKESLTKGVPSRVLQIVDATERWWPLVKRVRQYLHHREHVVIPFGHPEEGLLFQVYAGRSTPLITDPVLLWPKGSNVAQFEMYSAFVVAEAIALLEELGSAISEVFGIQLEHHMLTMGGCYKDVVSSLQALHEKAQRVLSERT